MRDRTETVHNAALLPAVLHGGPADLPDTIRVREVPPDEEKIKVSWLGGYEHFERDRQAAAPGAGGAVVFRWTLRTRIAE